MKTIEQASKAFAGINDDKAANTAKVYDKYDIESAFQHGVEFAQEWISIDEELPYAPNYIIAKDGIMHGYATIRIDAPIDIKFLKENFTHWRPIERI